MPRPEYDKNPKIYAEVPQEIKDKLDDIRAHLGYKSDKDTLIEIIEEYHKRHGVPPNKRRKKT